MLLPKIRRILSETSSFNSEKVEMSSTYVADSADSSPAENTVIIIVNDDTGNISVDQEMLQSLLSKFTLNIPNVVPKC